MHDRNRIADFLDEAHVVLDHDQRVPALQPVEDLRGLVGFLNGHAGGRLVHQDQFGVLRHQQRDLQPLGLAMGQIGGGRLHLVDEIDEAAKVFQTGGIVVLRARA